MRGKNWLRRLGFFLSWGVRRVLSLVGIIFLRSKGGEEVCLPLGVLEVLGSREGGG